jgi:hypothetical protein
MVDGELFDKLARIGSMIRNNPRVPFGGIQVRQRVLIISFTSDFKGIFR